jgi:hypothetical protein
MTVKLRCDDPEVLQAMVRLQSMTDFRLFLDWLHGSLWEMRKGNDIKTGPDKEWTQGACQHAQQVLNVVAESRDSLIALRDKRGP